MKKKRHLSFLLLIMLLGFVLRVSYLDKYPPGISWDEVSHGYNAYSILQTGKDEWGKLLPLSNFRAYGDYPLSLNLYLTIPSIAISGLNEFSIRFPHALLGTLTIAASYFLALGITKSKKISLLTSLLVAIEPFNWFLSRFVAQSNLSVFFLTAALAAFFNREKNKILMPLSAIFLGLTLYSYHTTRIVAPLIFLSALFVYKKDWKSIFGKSLWIKRLTLLFFLLFFLPLPFILANPESRARSSEVFLIDQGVVNRIIEKRQASNYPDVINRLLYNRPVYFAVEATKNHLGYYSPYFLFFEGGTHYQFSMPGKGLLFPINLPFFYFGLYLAIRKALGKDKNYQFILLWFLFAPISGSITKENFAVMRATPMIPLPQYFSAIGFFAFLNCAKQKVKKFNLKNVFLPLYLVILLLSLGNYLYEYLGTYAKSHSQYRQYGHREMVSYIKENYEEYDKIIITKKYGEPHEFLLFFWPWDSQKYQDDPNLIRFEQSNWFWVDRFDKFYFVNDWEIPKEEGIFVLESEKEEVDCTTDLKCLLITSPANYPEDWKNLKVINFLNGEPAFEIYEN
jgi:4-amino-4-deoxy-L-arabinose transferase-like glycosyltransferase